MLEQSLREVESSYDLLGPTLAIAGIMSKFNYTDITPQQAENLKTNCLAEYQERMLNRANNMQAQYDAVSNFNNKK